MKKIISACACAIMSIILLFCTTACSAPAPVDVNAAKIPQYNAVYTCKTYSNNEITLTYENNYSVKKQEVNGKSCLVVSTNAQAGDETEGIQSMTSKCVITLENGENFSACMPLSITEEYKNSKKESAHTLINAVHNQETKRASLSIKQYEKEDSAEMSEKTYSITLADQYFDEDSFAVTAIALPIKSGFSADVMLSASNREKLQNMKIEVKEDSKVECEAGTFDCYTVCMRPNTIFTSYCAYLYIDKATGILVQVEQTTSTLELKSYEMIEKAG